MIDILSFLMTPEKASHSPTIPEYISIAKDIILAISALAAAFIAWRCLATWRKELKGKSEYEIAKQVLKSVYKVREAFKHVRSPGTSYDIPDDLSGDSPKEHTYKDPMNILTLMEEFGEAFT
jgi:hypothetical protein